MIQPDAKIIGTVGCERAVTELQLVHDGPKIHGVDLSAEAIEVEKSPLTTARVIDPAEFFSNGAPVYRGTGTFAVQR